MKNKVLVITGPTATGKTDLSIVLAEKFNGEIINADSMQFYQKLDIGTNKTSQKERQIVPHHLIDFLPFDQNYSAGQFTKEARQVIEEITSRQKLPILVGGSNFFIQTVLGDRKLDGVSSNFQRIAEPDIDNQELIAGFKKFGQNLDNIADIKNSRRLERAIERLTDRPDASIGEKPSINNRIYDALIISLTTDRGILYQRIDQRVDQMLELGLEQEAKMLYDAGGKDFQSGKAIGYREWFDFFDGQIDREQVVQTIKTDTHRLAKKQITFVKNQFLDAEWFDIVNGSDELIKIQNLVSDWL